MSSDDPPDIPTAAVREDSLPPAPLQQPASVGKELFSLVELFETYMCVEDENLQSSLPHIKHILSKAAQWIFPILENIVDGVYPWPKELITKIVNSQLPKTPDKALSRASQVHLQAFFGDFFPLLQQFAESECSRLLLDGLKAHEEELNKEKEKSSLLETNLQEQTQAAEEAMDRAREQESNNAHMISEHKRLSQEIFSLQKKLQDSSPIQEELKKAQTELRSYEQKEEEFELAQNALKSQLEAERTKTAQLEEGNRIHLTKIQELEGRQQELLEQNKTLESQSWTTQGKRSFSVAASPSAPPPSSSQPSAPLSTGAVNKPSHFASQEVSPVNGQSVSTPFVPQTFVVNDLLAFTSSPSLEASKKYLKALHDLKDKVMVDIKLVFQSEWNIIEPKSKNLLPRSTNDQKAAAFKTILSEICVARNPNDLCNRMNFLKNGQSGSQPSASNGYFLLPGLIPGRKDFKELYNSTIKCANRTQIQFLIALHLPQLWLHIVLLEHYNDNLAARTKFVYAPRRDASEYEAALNLVCLFIAEEMCAFQRFLNKKGPKQTHHDRMMVPDYDGFHPDWIETICHMKRTPDCVRNMLVTENPFSTFHDIQIEEKREFRKRVHASSVPRSEPIKRKNSDIDHLFD